ncbi:MAG: hypothetical protein DRJ42_25440, partial [Deltaproteobacteria bacterium]
SDSDSDSDSNSDSDSDSDSDSASDSGADSGTDRAATASDAQNAPVDLPTSARTPRSIALGEVKDASIDAPSSPLAPPRQPRQYRPTPPPIRRKSGRSWLWLVAVAALVAAGVALYLRAGGH